MGERADKFFAERFGSRSKAANELNRGRVLRNGKPLKPSDLVSEEDGFTFVKEREFVSMGGYKLLRLFESYPIDVQGKVVADIGASTGGFTDCLLQFGAKRVYAVDVGESLLAPSLQEDPRIVSMENVNARNLTSLPEQIDALSADVSFISVTYLFSVFSRLLKDGGEAFVLIKPQFECGKSIGKSGVLKNAARREEIVSEVCKKAKDHSLMPVGLVNAPLSDKKNVEYMVWLKKNEKIFLTDREIREISKNLR
ncbi:MAG: TlyA family RNA methyltransferase [Clostridia bacterium]|nr:TlyA family RNA methyltransferase [Clostridia bacterium]